MNVSTAGREYIESKEGLRLAAYQDIVGVWTIGYGDARPGICRGMVITEERADAMLTERLADEFEPLVLDAINGAPTTQGQFDAMVSLAYNIGVHGFAASTVCRCHKAGDYNAAADAFMMWNKAGGEVVDALDKRRAEEGQMYLDASP